MKIGATSDANYRSLINRFFGRTGGAGFDHFGEKTGLFVIQRNGHSCDSLLSSQYRIWGRLSTQTNFTRT
jgi:hypothetical protein